MNDEQDWHNQAEAPYVSGTQPIPALTAPVFQVTKGVSAMPKPVQAQGPASGAPQQRGYEDLDAIYHTASAGAGDAPIIEDKYSAYADVVGGGAPARYVIAAPGNGTSYTARATEPKTVAKSVNTL